MSLWGIAGILPAFAGGSLDAAARFTRFAAVSPSFKVDVYMTGPNAFLLEQGKYLYSVETQTCQKFEKLAAPPEGGKGEMVGVFREEGGKLVFVAAQQPK